MIAEYGDADLLIQNLDHCTLSASSHHKKGTKITFGTDIGITLNGTDKLGLVVWFDRERMKEILDRTRAENAAKEKVQRVGSQ